MTSLESYGRKLREGNFAWPIHPRLSARRLETGCNAREFELARQVSASHCSYCIYDRQPVEQRSLNCTGARASVSRLWHLLETGTGGTRKIAACCSTLTMAGRPTGTTNARPTTISTRSTKQAADCLQNKQQFGKPPSESQVARIKPTCSLEPIGQVRAHGQCHLACQLLARENPAHFYNSANRVACGRSDKLTSSTTSSTTTTTMTMMTILVAYSWQQARNHLAHENPKSVAEYLASRGPAHQGRQLKNPNSVH